MPIRESISYHVGVNHFQQTVWVNGVLFSDAVADQPTSYYRDIVQRSWDNTPNFWTLRRARAKLPDNNFDFQFFRSESGTFHYTHTVSGPPNTRTFRDVSRLAPQLSRIPDHGFVLSEFDLYNRLVSQARRSDFSLPTAMAEAGRTVQMVASTARTLGSVIFNLRRGNLVGALRSLRVEPSNSQVSRFNRRFGINPNTTAANYWLQYQYGWKPLLNDVRNAAEALAIACNQSDAMTTSVSASSRMTGVRNYQDYTLESNPAYKGNISVVVNISRRAKWRFKAKAADLPGLFGLVNPFEVAWEIVPFSFVADWFLPIGRYLSALDVPLRFEHIGGSKGWRMQEMATTTPTYATYGGAQVPAVSGICTLHRVTGWRKKLTSAPTPSFSDMTFRPGLNATRATSAVALLWQQASRLGR